MGNVEYEFCPDCGARVQKDSSFCSVCGKDLKKKEKLKSKRPLGLSIFAIIWLVIGGMWFVISITALPLHIFLMRANWKLNLGLTAWGVVLLFMIIFGILMGASLIASFIGFWRRRSWSVKAFKIAFVFTVLYLMTLAYDDVKGLGVQSDDIIMWVLFGVLFMGTFYVLGKETTEQYLSNNR